MNHLLGRVRDSVKPAVLHLGVSLAIASIVLALIYRFWYPNELAEVQGVGKLIPILIGVDVAIGPLITLMIFVPGKKSLRFDLAVIAALQTIALLYGLKAIHGGRPAYVVFSVDRFDVVAYRDVDRASLERGTPGIKLSPWGPMWTGAQMPEDSKKRSEILFSALAGGPDLQHLPEYFLPLEDLRGEMLSKLRPMDELRKINALEPAAWQSLLAEFRKTEPELGYIPMVGNGKDGAVILDAKSGEVLGIRLLTPSFASPAKREAPSGGPPSPAPATSKGLG